MTSGSASSAADWAEALRTSSRARPHPHAGRRPVAAWLLGGSTPARSPVSCRAPAVRSPWFSVGSDVPGATSPEQPHVVQVPGIRVPANRRCLQVRGLRLCALGGLARRGHRQRHRDPAHGARGVDRARREGGTDGRRRRRSVRRLRLVSRRKGAASTGAAAGRACAGGCWRRCCGDGGREPPASSPRRCR